MPIAPKNGWKIILATAIMFAFAVNAISPPGVLAGADIGGHLFLPMVVKNGAPLPTPVQPPSTPVLPTPAPTTVPTPLPTTPPATGGVVILSHRGYVSGDYYRIAGEVWNNTTTPIKEVIITADVYDRNRSFLTTCSTNTYIYAPVIDPGEKAPFLIRCNNLPGIARYELRVDGYEISEDSALTVDVISHRIYTSGDTLRIVGEVRNNNTRPVEVTIIAATLYDSNGAVIAPCYTYTMVEALVPGGKSPFRVYCDDWDGMAYYELQAQAAWYADYPASTPIVVSHTAYKTSTGLEIYGEVRNYTGEARRFTQIVASVYDNQGQIVSGCNTYSLLSVIPAGGKSPFRLYCLDVPDYAWYSMQVEATPGGVPVAGVDIISHNGYDVGPFYTIAGQLRNNSAKTAKYVDVIATLYDAQGDVVSVCVDTATPSDVPPGGMASFEVNCLRWTGMYNYDLVVNAEMED